MSLVANLEWLSSASGTVEGVLQPVEPQIQRVVTWQVKELKSLPHTTYYILHTGQGDVCMSNRVGGGACLVRR